MFFTDLIPFALLLLCGIGIYTWLGSNLLSTSEVGKMGFDMTSIPAIFTLLGVTILFYVEIYSTIVSVTSRVVSFNELYYVSSSELYFVNFFFPILVILLFVTSMSFYSCLAYNSGEIGVFLLYLIVILGSGFGLLSTKSLPLFFTYYEFLLLPSFLILYRFAKTRKAIEAAYLMFFWTQFGAFLILITIFLLGYGHNCLTFEAIEGENFSVLEMNMMTTLLVLGFGVKWPMWPFYGWLPKAHVEASTNFSIFLSGVLVKFAFFGFLRFFFALSLEPTNLWLIPYLIFGLVDSVFKLIHQVDLKKMVAYTTVVEMHWLAIAVLSGYTPLFLSAIAMLWNHALISTNAFLLVDSMARSFKTRLATELGGIFFLTPKLYIALLLNTLLFLGFPGSLSFMTEILFFTFLFDLNPLLALFALIMVYVIASMFMFRIWLPIMFNNPLLRQKPIPSDLESRELVLMLTLLLLSFWLGIFWIKFLP